MIIEITKSAIKAIKNIESISSNKGLEITIETGGCSGLTYDFKLSDKKHFKPNEIFHIQSIYILIKHNLQSYLKNRQLDYKTELGQEYFEIIHPKGVVNCGCGKSFSI